MKARPKILLNSMLAIIAIELLPKPLLHILLLVFAVVLAFGKPNATPATFADSYPDPWDVSWLPSDQNQVINTINSIVTDPSAGGSPDSGLAGYGSTILYYSLNSIGGNPAGVNPAFALAMFRKEANFARPGTIAYTQNNPGNLRCAGYGMIDCQNGFAVFASMEDGIKAYFWMLQYQYKPGGGWPSNFNCTDITCIITHYCPPSQCDTETYIAQIGQWTQEFMSRISGGAGCCLCSDLNYSPSGSQAVGEHTLHISTVEFSFSTSTPTAFFTATPLPTPTETATPSATPTLTPTVTNTPPPISTPTTIATSTPRPTATPTWMAISTPDTSPPQGSLTINGGAGESWSLNVTLEVVAEDEESGVVDMRFSHDGIEWGAWESYQPTRAWKLPAQNGSHTIYAQLRDGAGNTSVPSSATITVALNPEKPSSQHYRIQSSVAGIGGGEKTSASYHVQNTTGQPSSIATSPSPFHSSDHFRLVSGYWGATVWPCISGDLNCSCIVNVEDIMFVASRWRCRRGDSCYDERFDMDKDDDIDIVE